MIEQAPGGGLAWNVVLHAAVADGQLAPTAPAADETSQQRVAVLGRAMMTARGHVLAHHPADRLRTLPIDVPVVRAGLERQPFAARLAAALRPNARTVGNGAGERSRGAAGALLVAPLLTACGCT